MDISITFLDFFFLRKMTNNLPILIHSYTYVSGLWKENSTVQNIDSDQSQIKCIETGSTHGPCSTFWNIIFCDIFTKIVSFCSRLFVFHLCLREKNTLV